MGVAKAGGHPLTTFALAVLAGVFVALGAMFATIAISTAPESVGLPYGLSKLLMGCAFSVGLILVVVGGAELFTSNVLLVMAWVSGRIEGAAMVRNWVIVYLGNFVGAFLTAGLVVLSQQYRSADGGVGYAALHLADGKGDLGFLRAVVLGVLCNTLVCLAVWLSYSARTTADRIVAVVPPVAAFVAAGFEHSVANMYFLPLAAMIKNSAPESFWSSIHADAGDFAHVGWQPFIANLLPVTIGNLIGGALIVGGLYWLAYLRPLTPGRRTGPVPPRTP
ncbi:formate transporter FocA [Kineosporia babensis]